MQVVYSARARADMDEIWQDIALDGGEALADKKIEHIDSRAAMLSRHPHMGLARPELADDARSLLVELSLLLFLNYATKQGHHKVSTLSEIVSA